MKLNFWRILLVLLLLITCYFCYRTYRIGTGIWKHCSDETVLMDFETFDYSIVSIFYNLLYTGEKPAAKLIDSQYRFGQDIVLIESLDGKHQGWYCRK